MPVRRGIGAAGGLRCPGSFTSAEPTLGGRTAAPRLRAGPVRAASRAPRRHAACAVGTAHFRGRPARRRPAHPAAARRCRRSQSLHLHGPHGADAFLVFRRPRRGRRRPRRARGRRGRGRRPRRLCRGQLRSRGPDRLARGLPGRSERRRARRHRHRDRVRRVPEHRRAPDEAVVLGDGDAPHRAGDLDALAFLQGQDFIDEPFAVPTCARLASRGESGARACRGAVRPCRAPGGAASRPRASASGRAVRSSSTTGSRARTCTRTARCRLARCARRLASASRATSATALPRATRACRASSSDEARRVAGPRTRTSSARRVWSVIHPVASPGRPSTPSRAASRR